MFNQISEIKNRIIFFDAEDNDKFKEKKYNDRPLYERLSGYSVSPSEMDIELKTCLGHFNKLYNYNCDFIKEDFEAINPIKLKKENDRWIPYYISKEGTIPYKINGFQTLNCCCSQHCGSLFLIRNKITDVYFGVGSVCIHKFIDKDFSNKINYLKNIALKKKCDICNDYIHTKKTKNQESNWSVKNKILNKTICNKCISKTIVILDIKYSEKDDFKRKYPIRWSVSASTWYLQGRVPEELQKKIIRIE